MVVVISGLVSLRADWPSAFACSCVVCPCLVLPESESVACERSSERSCRQTRSNIENDDQVVGGVPKACDVAGCWPSSPSPLLYSSSSDVSSVRRAECASVAGKLLYQMSS
ncbi:unnamed protein product [Hapterophycus canaliculatus]